MICEEETIKIQSGAERSKQFEFVKFGRRMRDLFRKCSDAIRLKKTLSEAELDDFFLTSWHFSHFMILFSVSWS